MLARVMVALAVGPACLAAAGQAQAARMTIPRTARQLVVVSSPTADPPGSQAIATLRAYTRVGRGSPWRPAFGPWPAETGSGHLIDAAHRREGDGATPTGVFSFGHTIYGTRTDPGGLHYRFHHLVCGDWWDEDPYSVRYNRFVHVRCEREPSFAPGSEALWTEALAYPYFAVIDFNTGPTSRGAAATGSGIFMHSWIGTATQGCVALPTERLLALLRWLRPSRHPVIEIGTDAELGRL